MSAGGGAGQSLRVRDMLIKELRDDIVGPRGGPEEVLPSSESPLRGYMSGILFPRHMQPDEEDNEGRSGVQAGSSSAGSEADGDEAGDAGGAGAGAGNVPLTGANPSSLGLTCTLAPGAHAVRARIDYGTYVEEKEGGDSGPKQFRRVPHLETIDIPADRPCSKSVPLRDHPEFEARYSVKDVPGGGRTLRMFVVNTNDHLGAEPPGASRCVFQPRITLLPPAGAAGASARIFVGAGAGDDGLLDPDTALFEMMFRDKIHVAVGHCCAVHWDQKEAADHGAVSSVETTFVPRYDVPHIGPRRSDIACLDMKTLYEAGAADYGALLSPLADAYEAWISSELESRMGAVPARHKRAAERQAAECRNALRRIRRGIEIVSTDAHAADAFSFANRAMHLQMSHTMWIRDKRAGRSAPAYEPGRYECRWYMFQLAFFLLNVESITDPDSDDRETADLLWFPTGGGKTEAYLGLIAFTIAHRRVRPGGANHLRYGTAVIMRYTLRLLTLQQFHRAAALMCACEFVRRHDAGKWGDEPFLVGLWVGSGATPNTLERAREAIDEARAGRPRRGENPVQIIECPWCGAGITARNYRVSGTPEQCRVHCSDKYCDFSDRPGAGESGLPVLVVDEDVYRRCPSMVIGTVDKFAQLTWKWRAGALFGRVDKYCQKHGFTIDALDGDCNTHTNAEIFLLGDHGPGRLDPPELIIQDELHLISGPLGTLTGIYETAIDGLCSGGSRAGRPKIVASTATAKKAPGQIAAVFDRHDSRVFPPQGLDYGESFFATTYDRSEKPGRAYLGMCVTSRSGPTVLGRLSAAVLRKVRALEEGGEFAPGDLDPYYTLVSYFNTLRDLGGANKMYDDTVPRLVQRIHANFEGGASGGDKGGAGRTYRDALLEKKELTSRIDSSDIPDILRDLEVPVGGSGSQGAGGSGSQGAVDVLLCTNMLSVGVDIPRLGAMIVNGQPKNHSEYIQATGRIGRASPGLVIANLNYLKPRDLSHYEDFVHYHSTLHKNVEPNTVTPFSPRSRDRALLAVLVAMVRHEDARLASNAGASRFRRFPPELDAAKILGRARAAIAARARRVDPGEEEGTLNDIDRLAEVWHGAALGRLPLQYSRPWHPKASQPENIEYLMRQTGEDSSKGLEEAPNSLRDAEPPVAMWYLDNMGGGEGGA